MTHTEIRGVRSPGLWSLVLTIAAVTLVARAAPARAQLDPRCGLKVGAAISADPSPNLAHESMAALVEEQLQSPEFIALFASFINTRFNRGLSMSAEEDAVFYVVSHVLENDLPWSDVYLGAWAWGGPSGYPQLTDDPSGISYFTAPGWVRRYAGNDIDGAMLFAAYRVVQNTTGIVLVPSPFNADQNSDYEGRQRQPCASCHLESALALDKIAAFFPTREGFGNAMVLTPPANTEQELLNGRSYTNLRELLGGLLQTDDYRFWTCRLVFEYTYGRPESAC